MTRHGGPQVLAVLAIAVSMSAQAAADAPQARPHPTPATLQGTWMTELLDLDMPAAIQGYERIAKDADQPLLHRQIALARLAELHRPGTESPATAVDLSILPDTLRRHFEEFLANEHTSPVLSRELEAAQGSLAVVQEFFAITEQPQLRSLVTPILQARRDEQIIQRQPRRMSRVLDRILAKDVLRAELEGHRKEAADLRSTHFGYWTPAPWPEDADQSWVVVQRNLERWIQERQLSADERVLLRRLLVTLRELATNDVQQALRLLDRLPLYAESLRRDGSRGR